MNVIIVHYPIPPILLIYLVLFDSLATAFVSDGSKYSDRASSSDDIIIIAGETPQSLQPLSNSVTKSHHNSNDELKSEPALSSFTRGLTLRGLTSRNKLKKVSTSSNGPSDKGKLKKSNSQQQQGNTIIIVSPSKPASNDASDMAHPSVNTNQQMFDHMYAASYESMMPAVYPPPPPPGNMYPNSPHMGHVNPSMIPTLHSAPPPYGVMHSSSSHHFPPPPHFAHHHHSMMHHHLPSSSINNSGRIHFEDERRKKKKKKKKKAKVRTTPATTTTTTTTPKPPTEIFFGLTSPFASAQNTYNTMAEMRPNLMAMMANGYGGGGGGGGGGKDDHSMGPIELGKIPQIIIRVPAPIVNVPTPIVNVPPAIVNVSAPIVNVPPTEVMVPTPVVNVPPAIVNVSVPEISIPPAVVNVPKKLILRKEIKIMSKNKGSKNPIEMENEEFDTGYKSSSTDLAEAKKNANSPNENQEEEEPENDSDYQSNTKTRRNNQGQGYSNRFYHQPASVQMPPQQQQQYNQQAFYQQQQQQQQQAMYPQMNSHPGQNNNQYPMNNQYQNNGFYMNQYPQMQGQNDMKGNYNGQMMQQQQQQQQQHPGMYFASMNSNQQMHSGGMNQQQQQQDNNQMNQQSHQPSDYSGHVNAHQITIPPGGHTVRVTIPMPLSPNTLGQSLMAKEAGDKQQQHHMQSHKVNEDRGKSLGVNQSGKNLHNQEQQDETAEEKDESLDGSSDDNESLTNDLIIPPKRQSSGNKLTSSMKNEDIVTLFKLNNASRRKYSSPNYGSNIAVLHDEKQQPNIVFEKSDSIDDRSISDVNTHPATDSVSPNLFDSKNGASASLDDYSSTINSSPSDDESSLVNEAASSSPGDEAFLMRNPSPFTGDLMMYQDQRDAPVYAPLGQRIAASLTSSNKSHPVHSSVSQRLLKILNDNRQSKFNQSGGKLKKDNFNDSGDPGGGREDTQMTDDITAESAAIESLSLPQGGLVPTSSVYEGANDEDTDYNPLIK